MSVCVVEVFCAVPEWKTKELLAFASRKTAETDQARAESESPNRAVPERA